MSELPDLLVEAAEKNEVLEDEDFEFNDAEQTKQIEDLQAKLLALRG